MRGRQTQSLMPQSIPQPAQRDENGGWSASREPHLAKAHNLNANLLMPLKLTAIPDQDDFFFFPQEGKKEEDE